jgi:Protein of unknown function (DUF3667)
MKQPQASSEAAVSVVLAQCRNCGTALNGRFCANCSQAADVHVPSTRELLHEALEGITHSDSRLWRTLLFLWFKPGKLTQEFIAGRRMAYLPPFRLYLVMSVIFFLVASFSSPHTKIFNFAQVNNTSAATPESECADWHFTTGGRDWGERFRHACIAVVRDQGTSLLHVAVGTMPKAMFIFLPLVAFLHMLMYWWPRHRYVVHLLFFLHVHAFFFSVMTIVVLLANCANFWPKLATSWNYVPWLLWSMGSYTVLAMRRVFARSWAGTLFKAFALFLIYSVVLSITLVGVFVYAAMQL